MRKLLFLLFMVSMLACSTSKNTNLPVLKPSQQEAKVLAKVVSYENPEGLTIDCGAEQCFAKIQIDSVIEVGQYFSTSMNTENPILVYFANGMEKIEPKEENTMSVSQEAIKPKQSMVATIKLEGEHEGEPIYKVGQYKKLK